MNIKPPPVEDPVGMTAEELAEHVKTWVARVRAVQTRLYPTPRAVWDELYAEDVNYELFTECSADEVMVGDVQSGKEPFTLQNVLDGIAQDGIWGFTDQCHVIHYWYDPEICTTERRVNFWGHELSHAVMEPLLAAFPDGLSDEILANVMGEIAVMATIMHCTR